jgi:galactofuranosylgalactofuranosylrhamnosyl-N-acetylglucosaminyl-diphospho-decaprenol beta-1,5/1,6-galactofuranosyltransferase
LFVKAALGAVRQVLPVSELSKEHPAMVVPSQDAQWWLLSNTDGALVSSADGTTTSWYRRDPELFRTLMAQSVTLHARLSREWPKLRKRYIDAAPDFTSPARWRETFEASAPKD